MKNEIYNEVIKTIKKRRSIRKYKSDKKVPKDTINLLLECAVLAPSAMHRCPWHFIVIEDRKKIQELSKKVKEQMKILGYGMKFLELISSKKDLIFYNAPLIIIITCDKKIKWRKEDSALAMENMFLAATSLGLGSCWIGYAHRLNSNEDVLKEIGVPESHEITGVGIFGYPADEEKKTPERKAKVVKWWE